ncbi:hypothetical protein OPV22_000758 [Ensete ventricosum]|uniref:Uncharacterized protein n=1 Tax=Ensete ventricosum TaxID=4639 RepID=A0AAV8RVT7_ENSVE|nr:hypothetical protein OPV22_000758 [Ensete ventricosum]
MVKVKPGSCMYSTGHFKRAFVFLGGNSLHSYSMHLSSPSSEQSSLLYGNHLESSSLARTVTKNWLSTFIFLQRNSFDYLVTLHWRGILDSTPPKLKLDQDPRQLTLQYWGFYHMGSQS